MANFIPEKDKKVKTAPEQPNTKSEIYDDELDNVSGGVTILKPIITDTDNEVDDEELDGVSGGYETLRRGPSSGKSNEAGEDNESGGYTPGGCAQLS